MKATLKETSTITPPEQRIWVVGYSNIKLTFKSKKAAKECKVILDSSTPTITIDKNEELRRKEL